MNSCGTVNRPPLMNIFGGGGGGSTVKPPKLKQVDVAQAADTFTKYQQENYRLRDTDFASRFPELVNLRNSLIGESTAQLSGALPSQSKSALTTAGLGGEASAMEGKNEFETSRNSGNNILAKEQRDRNYFENILNNGAAGDVGKRDLSLGIDDILKIVTANSGNQNAFNQAIYGTQLNDYTSRLGQQAQNYGAVANTIGSVTDLISKFYHPAQSAYTDPFSPAWGYTGGATNWGAPNTSFTPGISDNAALGG